MKLYGYKKCGTCRKAETWLSEHNKKFTFIDITECPPKISELKKMVQQSGEPLKKFFNTSGVAYREMKVKEKLPGLTDADTLSMLANCGRLIKRPLVTDGKRTTVGFKEDIFKKMWR